MDELSSFFRTNPEAVAAQCIGYLEEADLLHPRNKKRYLVIAAALIDAVAGSIEAMDPGIFLRCLDPYLKKRAPRDTASLLPGIITAIERAAMECQANVVQTRFIWSLFHQARMITMNIPPGTPAGPATGTKRPEGAADGPAEATLSALKQEIAERRRVEEKLRESEHKFRDIAELTPQVIFELDTDVMITFTNKQALELFGYTEEDIEKGVSAYDLFPEYERGAARDNIRKTITGERGTTGYEYTAQRKDGTTFPVIIYATAIFKNGRHTGFRGVLVDIGQLKKAEEELRERERRFRDLAESMPQVIFEMDEKGVLTFANRQAYEIYGYSDEDFNAGIEALSLIAPQDLPRIKEGLRKIAEGGPPTGNEYTAIKKDGSLFPISTHVTRIMKGGRLAGYRGIIIDITERKRAEEALRKSEERFRRYFEVPLIGVAIVSPEGYWLEVNDKFCDMVGFSRDELLGMKWQDITPAEDLPGEAAAYKSFLKGPLDLVATREKRYRRKDGAAIDVILSTHCVRTSDGSPDYMMSVIQDITERARNERKIIESEQALRAILAASPIGICRIRDRTFEWASEALQEITGYGIDELAERRSRFLYGSDSEFERVGEILYREGQVETKWVRKDGGTRDILLQVSPTDSYSYIMTATDITGRKRAEEVMRLNESRTQALLKLHQMGNKQLKEITDFTLEESVRLTRSTIGYIAFLNEEETVLTMHSWSRNAMRDCSIEDKPVEYPLVTTGLWGEPVRQRKPVITNDYTSPDPLKKGYPEGHVDVKRHLGVPVFDGEKIVAVIGVGNKEDEYNESDISQLSLMVQGMLRLLKQKAAQEALGVSESRLRAIIESARDSIFIKDTDRRYVVANNAMSKLFGIPMDELIGKLDGELFGTEIDSHIEKMDSRVLQGETIEEEQPRPVGNVVHIFHTIKVPLRNDRGEIVGLCGIARDITERKHLESQLMHSQKMEAIGTLAGGVAHDFNNLLSAIMGYASLLQMKVDRDSPLHSYVSHILTSSEKAANLTHSLLAFSRKQVINLKPLVVNDAVEKLHRLLLRLIPEDVEFRIDKAPERLIALGDAGQIDQVIMNLVTNARDAMPRGGKLTIAVDHTMIDSAFIVTHGFGSPGEYAVINVSDTGTGMDEKTMEKIFEPFFTTKEVGRGTGLGLAIAYGIVKQHNGYIDVKSMSGEGSTFSVYLPLVWLEPMDEAIDEETVGGNETILIAEDNNELRALSVNVLEDKGYTVFAARDGAEAVEVFRLHQSDIALIILDVVMPKMNGREVFEAIKKIDPSARVIFTSGYTDDIIEEKGMADGEYDFLGKPITPGMLLRKIREVLDRE